MVLPDTIFVTGTGTDIGKTVVSAILAEALGAHYWKPVQAGSLDNTDSDWVSSVTSVGRAGIYPGTYALRLAASPHIAAREEGVKISIDDIVRQRLALSPEKLVVEGAGGLMVPLNETEFVADLIKALNVPVVLVSRNVLGSINHSLLTAMACRSKGIKVLGWIFNDDYLSYEAEIVSWSGIPKLFTVPHMDNPGKNFVRQQADLFRKIVSDLP
jgi:dethiobiotin synthetase